MTEHQLGLYLTALQDSFPNSLTAEQNAIDPQTADLSDVKSIFKWLGLEVEFDTAGNICLASFPWTNVNSLERVLEAIEDLVQDGTLIMFEDEDGESWSWPEQQSTASEISSEVVTSLNLTIGFAIMMLGVMGDAPPSLYGVISVTSVQTKLTGK